MSLYQDLMAGRYLDPVYRTCSNYSYPAFQTKGFNCDNPSLFSAEAMLLCGLGNWPLYPEFFDAAEVPGKNGLFHRYPGDPGEISADEIIGAATLDRDVAQSIWLYGWKHWWVFQPQGGKFVWASWMARFVNLPAYVAHCAGKGMDGLEGLWALACVLSVFSSGTSGKLLMWVQIQKVQGHYAACDLAIRFWKWRMRKQYPGGLKEVMTVYFGPQHPFAQNAPGCF
jgi:hypothetical protein